MKYFIILLLFPFTSCLKAQLSESKVECKVTHAYWEACETGIGPCNPFTIERQVGEPTTIVMPCGGTFTSVTLSSKGKTIKSLSIGHDECPPTFDLTDLPDGEYGAYMLACGLGGGIKFNLVTKKR